MVGRLVIIACAFAFRKFVGLDCYDIDNQTFISIWAKDIHKYKIWGIEKSKVKRKWISEDDKKLNIPVINSEKDFYNQGFDNFNWLRGYRHLPYIDIRTGENYNLDYCVIVSKYIENDKIYYRYIKNTDRRVCYIREDNLIDCISNNKIYFCNIKNYNDRVTALYGKFYEETAISKGITTFKNNAHNKIEKLKENEFINYSLSSNLESKETIEQRRHFNRNYNIMRKDISKSNKQITPKQVDLINQNRKLFMNTMRNGSNVMLLPLHSLGLEEIENKKKGMQSVSNYINSDSDSFLEELDSFEQFPCLDKSCKDLLAYIKKNFNYANKDDRAYLIKEYFYNNFKNEFINLCSKCYTMMSLYAMSYFQERKAAGFSSMKLCNENFINVEKQYIYSLNTFFVTIHEYIHYLSNNPEKRLSGFKDNKRNENIDSILTEGITDLLACYFTEYILNKINTDDIPIVYKSKYNITKKDYPTFINPFLRNINQLKEFDFNDIEAVTKKTLVAYNYNVCLIYYILSRVNCNDVFKLFFTQNREEFFNLCKKEFGEDTWNTFVTIGNYFSEAKLNKYEYLELLEKLKGETLC